MISTTANAANVSIMLLIDQRFCMTPPYSTTSPGTLISPTRVAAVICQEVSPALSHVGASRGMHLLRFVDTHPRPRAVAEPDGPKLTCTGFWRAWLRAIAVRPAIRCEAWTYG